MTRQDRRAAEIDALGVLLESHGADRTRWPARDRLRFAQVLAEDAEARRLLAEATALERLLELAPTPSPEREQEVSARIVAMAQGQAPSSAARPEEESVVRLYAPRSGVKLLPAAALLAASLLVGVFAGSSGVLERLLDVAGIGRVTDVRQATLDDDLGAFLDPEELL
jgi:hypothetical protein